MNPATVSKSLQDLSDEQRKDLIKAIQSGKCILILGPDANLMTDADGLTTTQQSVVAKALASELPPSDDMAPDEAENLSDVIGRFLLYTEQDPRQLQEKIVDYYGKYEIDVSENSLYNLIPTLGFTTVFNADPGNRLLTFFQANREVTGLYLSFRQPKISFMPDLPELEEIDPKLPLILNLFGLLEDPASLAIGSEEELKQEYALTSQEVQKEFGEKMGDRLRECEWYLCAGFNFNAGLLASILYFIGVQNDKFKLAQVFGLHPEKAQPLPNAQIIYYKNLFVNSKKSNVLLTTLDAKKFFTDLNSLAASFRQGRQAFIVFHPKNGDNLAKWLKQASVQFEEASVGLAYNQPAFVGAEMPAEADINQHIQNDDLVLFLISSDWIGLPQYDRYFGLLQPRKQQKKQKVLAYLVDDFNWRGEKSIKDAMLAGTLEVPKNLITENDREAALSGLDSSIRKIMTTA